MKNKQADHFTYEDAINMYFDGVKGLAKAKLPFTCKCGSREYPDFILGTSLPIMHLTHCFQHIRRVHKEKIKK